MDELKKQIETLNKQIEKLQIQNDTKSLEIQNLKDKLTSQPLYPTLSENLNENIENENPMTLNQVLKFLTKTFSGDPKTLNAFITKCELAWVNCPQNQKHNLLNFILGQIEGDAATSIMHREFSSWEQVKTELKTIYKSPRNYQQLNVELAELKQKSNENIQSYFNRVFKIISEIKELGKNDPAIAGSFKLIETQGLNQFILKSEPKISIFLQCSKPTSLQDALAMALNFEKLNPQNEVRKPNKYCSHCKTQTHNTVDCRKSGRKECTVCKKPGHSEKNCWYNKNEKSQNFKSESNLFTLSCAYCKKSGHVIKDCRKREYNNKKRAEEMNKKSNEPTTEAKPFSSVNLIQSPNNFLISLTEFGTQKKFQLLIDTGAEISIIKASDLTIEQKRTINTSNKKLIVGITQTENLYSEGTVEIIIIHNQKKYAINFHVVKEEKIQIPYDGIFGMNIINHLQANLNFSTWQLSFFFESNEIIFDLQREYHIPARTKSICMVQTKSELEEGLPDIHSSNPNILIENNAIYKKSDNFIPVVMTNPTNIDQKVIVSSTPLTAIKTQIYHHIFALSGIQRTKTLTSMIRLDHLENHEKMETLTLIHKYQNLFFLPGDTLQAEITSEHRINTPSNAQPIYTKNYRFPEIHKKEVEKQMTDLKRQGIIKDSESPWNSPIWIVPKKQDASGIQKWRIVIDYRKLNEITKADKFPIPNIDDIFDQLGNSKYFTTLDLASGFHQIPVHPKDQEKTAFSTHQGHFEFVKMPFGLKNAPATFQRIMNSVLTGLVGNECFVYLDDIIIYSSNFSEHLRKLEKVFQRIQANHLMIQPDKSEFIHTQIQYLGHIICKDGIKPNPTKIQALKNYPRPKNEKEIQQFLGLCGYYRKFIQNYSEKTKPLTNLLKKSTKFEWKNEQQNSFLQLIQELTSDSLLLQYPDFEKLFSLSTDASKFAIGAVLNQENKPISYASRTLNKAEINYSVIEKELLAIVWAIKHFRPYLYGRKFEISTDHKPLVWLFNTKDPGSRLYRWKIKLSEYNFDIRYIQGSKNSVADALSRIYPIAGTSQETSFEKIIIKPYHEFKNIAILTSQDQARENALLQKEKIEITKTTEIQIIKKSNRNIFIIFTRPTKYDKANSNLYRQSLDNLRNVLEKEQITIIGIIDDFNSSSSIHSKEFETQLISQLSPVKLYWTSIQKIPKNTVQFLMETHSNPLVGHSGGHSLYEKLRSKGFYWPKMKKEIFEVTNSCNECQIYNPLRQPTKIQTQITDTPDKPAQRLAMDIIGPFNDQVEIKNILSIQDCFTKFIQLIPLKTNTAPYITKKLIKIFMTQGIPTQILTDNGVQFRSNAFIEMCEQFKIQHILTSMYHPASNGSLERSHASVKYYLNKFPKTKWPLAIYQAQYCFNSSKHSTTNITPFELQFGQKARIPILEANQMIDEDLPEYRTFLHQQAEKFSHTYENIKNRTLSKKKIAAYYRDQRENRKNKYPNYQIGDLILVKEMTGDTTNKKFFEGPYPISDVSQINVTIKRNNKMLTVHKDDIKKYNPPKRKIHLINLPILFIISLFFPLCLGQGLITPLSDHPGIHVDYLGEASIFSGTWNLLTYFNISQIDIKIKHLEFLHNYVNSLELKRFNHTKLKILDTQLHTISTKYSDLLTSTENTRLHKRETIFGFSSPLEMSIGHPLAAIFGFRSDSEGQEADYKIQQAFSNEEILRNVVKHQISLINNTIQNFQKSNIIFEKNIQKSENWMSLMGRQLEKINTTLTQQIYTNIADEVYHQFEATYELSTQEIENLQNAILFAKRDILHPIILSPTDLFKQLNSIHLPNKFKFPIPILNIHQVERYADISKIHSSLLNNQLFFLIKIPLATNVNYNLYNSLPLPFSHQDPNVFFYVQPTNNYFLIDDNINTYQFFQSLTECTQLSPFNYLCFITELDQHIVKQCEIELILGNSEHCTIQKFASQKLRIWHKLPRDRWLFSLSQTYSLTLLCNQEKQTFQLPQIGILHLPLGCTAYWDNKIFKSTAVYTTNITQNLITLPPFHLVVDNFSLPPNMNIPTYKLEHINLDNFNDLSAQLQRDLDDVNKNFTVLPHVTWVNTILNFLFLFLILYILFGCCYVHCLGGSWKTIFCCFSMKRTHHVRHSPLPIRYYTRPGPVITEYDENTSPSRPHTRSQTRAVRLG